MLSVIAPIIIEILTIITQILDFIAVTNIAISIFQFVVSRFFARHDFVFPHYKKRLGGSSSSSNRKYNFFKMKLFGGNICIGDLVKGLLLSLEFESASAILKLGIFTTSITLLSEPLSSNLDKFAFFVGILTLRIVLNQSLRKYEIN
ncbi:hypothetical protein [Candidatus Nitrosocosmicus sp. SS]|uniref:hypothetical protein n=1 Tax=Candidatus Nitrosocosmicus agrestis TaxID=2563600 RepID=UPI00122E1061|nr:hypothetical protein [Candidatus Nitrosocosmicus sp. SS]KAA2280437.1 hypothetical protein F1Z66_10575 [Candidatus Nitrosocosmicus sp. SS]KAF0869215.1 hypothetical protein E5N71_05780 [Candidatus Nitrosocosmicus sp. SS]